MGSLVSKTQNIYSEIKQYFFVFNQLIERDRKHNLSSTFLGEIWEILNPLINMIVMVLVFGEMFGKGQAGTYPIYILTGTTIYGLYANGTTGCLNALQGNKNFLIKTQLDKRIYIQEKVMLALKNFIYSLFVFAFVLAIYDISPRWEWLLIIPDIALLLLFITGVGKILSVINVMYADITYFYKIVVLMFFYGSALFYRVEKMNPVMQKLMAFNPLYLSIAIARGAVLNEGNIGMGNWMFYLGITVMVYIIGTLYFNRVIDEIVSKI